MKNKWVQMVKITLLLICLAVPTTLFMLPAQEAKAALQEEVYEEGYSGDIVDLIRVKKAADGTDLDGDGTQGGAEDLRQMRYFLVGKVDKFYKTMGISYGYNTGDINTPGQVACYYVANNQSYTGTTVEVLSTYNDGEHGEKAVSYVGNSAFYGNQTITKVKLPTSVLELRGNSFRACTALETVYMPGVPLLRPHTGITAENTGDGNLHQRWNFYGCTSLNTIVVPEGFTVRNGQFGGVGENTVDICVIGDSIEGIAIEEHAENKALSEKAYTLSIAKRADYASECGTWKYDVANEAGLVKSTRYEHVYAEDGTHKCNHCWMYDTMGITYGYNSGDNQTPNKAACYYVADDSGHTGTSVEVLSTYDDGEHGEMAVSYVGNSAFYGNQTITKVKLPESVKVLRGLSFWGCSNLETIIMPGVQRLWRDKDNGIEYRNFSNCTSLETVVVGNNFWLQDEQFTHGNDWTTKCPTKHVTLYVSGQQLHTATANNYTFNPCVNTTVYHYDKDAVHGDDTWKYDEKGNAVLMSHTYVDDKCSTCEAHDGKGIVYGYNPGDSANGNKECYYVANNKDCELETVNVASTYNDGVHGEHPVTYVGYEAFSGNTTIKKVILPSSVTALRGYAFQNCSNLETVIAPGVVSMGRMSTQWIGGDGLGYQHRNFRYCHKLTTVVVGNNVKIEEEQFVNFDANTDKCETGHANLFVTGTKINSILNTNNPCLTGNIYYYDATGTQSGYWHYVEGEVVLIQ